MPSSKSLNANNKSANKVRKSANSKAKNNRKGAVTAASRAQISFAPSRLMRLMRRERLNERVGQGAAVYLAGGIDYLCSEIIQLAGEQALAGRKQRIAPRHLKLALADDKELKYLCKDAVIAEGGVKPTVFATKAA